MEDKDMLTALQTILENLSFYGDRTTYQKMLVLLDKINSRLLYDLEIDYPIEICEEPPKIKPGAFDF